MVADALSRAIHQTKAIEACSSIVPDADSQRQATVEDAKDLDCQKFLQAESGLLEYIL